MLVLEPIYLFMFAYTTLITYASTLRKSLINYIHSKCQTDLLSQDRHYVCAWDSRAAANKRKDISHSHKFYIFDFEVSAAYDIFTQE